MVFINIYWKDSRSGGFCKHSSSLYNQAVEVIYSLPRSGHDAWGLSIRIAQASEVSNKKLSTEGCPDHDI